MKFIDVPVGQRVVLVEKMGDPNGEFEIRHTHYERADGPTLYERNTKAFRLRTTQGVPGEEPRYDCGEHRTPTEVHSQLPVEIYPNPPAEGAA